MRTFFMLYVVPYEVLCHCERSVAISRKGILFFLWHVTGAFAI